MLLKASIIAALLAAVQVQALPSPAGEEVVDLSTPGYKLVDTEQVAEGVLTYYGADPDTAPAVDEASDSQLERRCGGNSVTCGKNYVPAHNTCNDLIASMKGSSKKLANKPRAVCLSRSGKNCCISWNKDIGSVKQSSLYNAATKTNKVCVAEGKSGKARDVSINGKCLEQCLSNRTGGC